MSFPSHNSATWIVGILALCGPTLGGVHLHQEVEDDFLASFRASADGASKLKTVPASVALETLHGALDLASTLATGAAVYAAGLLQEGQITQLLMRRADKLDPACAASLSAALDAGELTLIAVTDLADENAALSSKLDSRLTFQVAETAEAVWTAQQVAAAAKRLPDIVIPENTILSLSEAALSLGIPSPRHVTQAVQAARAVAALTDCNVITDDAVALVAQLVFAHRATQLPQMDDDEPEAPQQPDNTEPDDHPGTDQNIENAERLVEAVKSAIPHDLLQSLVAQAGAKGGGRNAKSAASRKAAGTRGRRIGHKRATSIARQRLDVLATLRSAAPWQPLRRKLAMSDRMVVTRDDFRVSRIKQRNQTTAIFAVDASGSTAFQRLAEAKGAVEAVLAECYVRRDHVALVSFRSKTSEILLPPTRSLERAKRALAALPGGGGTPLASGLDNAFALAMQVRRSGQTPTVIMLTDGRANVTRAGEGNKVKAQEETLAAARIFAAERIDAMVIDVSPDPQKHARALAEAMGARYLPMPRAGALEIAKPVRQLMASRAT
jgi:magnesium chelatase subunit D